MAEYRRFTECEIQEARDGIALADLIARRVLLHKEGRELVGLCPFHDEKTPSFKINEAKGFYHCFGCGAHGGVIDFVMLTEGLDFAKAMAWLLGGAEPANGSPPPKPRPKKRPDDDAIADKRRNGSPNLYSA